MFFKTLSKASLGLIAIGALSLACSSDKAEEAAASSALTISGSLSGGVSGSKLTKMENLTQLALSDYKVRCVTLSGNPQAGEGTVGADGSFSLSIAAGDSAVNIGCFILKAADSAIVATIAFETSSTGLDGNNVTEGAIPGGGNGGIGLGAINFDPDEGTAIANKDNITRTGAAADITEVAGTWVDPTGEWTMSCVDPAHCPEEGASGTFPIYLNQVAVTELGSIAHTGMGVWDGEQRFNDCGGTEDLDTILPAGYTADVAGMNTDFSFAAIPVAAAAEAPVWFDGVNNVTVCGYQVSQGDSCDLSGTVNPDGWTDGNGVTLNEVDCEAMCIADSLQDRDEEQSGCFARYEVDHSLSLLDTIMTIPGDLDGELTSFAAGSTANNFLVQSTEPHGRHAIGELIISGNTGTLHSEKSRVEHYCKDNGSGCDDVKCTLREVVVISIVQQSASAAIVDVAITETIDADLADSDAECFEDNPENHIFNSQEGAIRTEHFLLSGTK